MNRHPTVAVAIWDEIATRERRAYGLAQTYVGIMNSSMDTFTVLVADDSAVYRKLVEQSLSEEDCSVLFASRGREAIEIFERERPDLVITDWMMPDLTGIELCQRIRAGA